MKRKNSFFLIGMTSVLLAFAMIGCDQGTKVEYRDRVVGGNGGNTGSGLTATPTELLKRDMDEDNVAYVTDARNIGTLTLESGQTLVVDASTGFDPTSPSVNRLGAEASEGPLFGVSRAPGTLNITGKLTLESGSILVITGGAAVNVKTPTGSGNEGVLYVKKGRRWALELTPTPWRRQG
jgi:hypothetical protein